MSLVKCYDTKELMVKVNLYDEAIVSDYGEVRKGIVTLISERGINIKNDKGIKFYKWCHVKQIYKNLY